MGPYIVSCVSSSGAVEIQDPVSGATFKLNAQWLKQLLEMPSKEDVEGLIFCEPSSEE